MPQARTNTPVPSRRIRKSAHFDDALTHRTNSSATSANLLERLKFTRSGLLSLVRNGRTRRPRRGTKEYASSKPSKAHGPHQECPASRRIGPRPRTHLINPAGIQPTTHPGWRRCTCKDSQYSRSSRLSGPAPRRPRCHADVYEMSSNTRSTMTL